MPKQDSKRVSKIPSGQSIVREKNTAGANFPREESEVLHTFAAEEYEMLPHETNINDYLDNS